jgi:hypothetical protein
VATSTSSASSAQSFLYHELEGPPEAAVRVSDSLDSFLQALAPDLS